MKQILCMAALFAGVTALVKAEDWSGILIDATCYEQRQQEKTVSCSANTGTTVFALSVSGKIYKLDAAGSAKAAAALKYAKPVSGPVADPGLPPVSTGVKATVTGTEAGGMIMVESVGLQ